MIILALVLATVGQSPERIHWIIDGTVPIAVVPKPVPKPAPKPAIAPVQPAMRTTVCQCRGYNESVCLCLRSGVACHCSANVGSVWWVDANNRLRGKTGAKVNPNTRAPAAPPQRTYQLQQRPVIRPFLFQGSATAC